VFCLANEGHAFNATGPQACIQFLPQSKVGPVDVRMAKRSIGCVILLCSNATHQSVFRDCPGSRYSRAVFDSDDLAISGRARSSAPYREGAMVAFLRQWRQPYPLGSIHKHKHRAYTRWREYLLFGPCISPKWRASCGRWTRNQLGGFA
jgi:hypothetical protein